MAIVPQLAGAQLTINIRYTGENGSARKYVEEMESSGIAARIRAIEGCIRYDYFYPADDPEGLLLIDEWTGQEALDRYHSSPVMQEAAALREKYKLGGRQVRMFNPAMPASVPDNQARQPQPAQPVTEPSHILYGSDYPYVAAPALVGARTALEARLAAHGLDPQAVMADNAARLFAQ